MAPRCKMEQCLSISSLNMGLLYGLHSGAGRNEGQNPVSEAVSGSSWESFLKSITPWA